MRTILKHHWPVILFLMLYLIVIGYKLITQVTPFFDFDESLYIQTGKEMFENRYFILPMWMGEIWLDKPPLIPFLYWTVAQLLFFVQPEVSTRLFSLLVAVGVLALVYKLYYTAVKQRLIALTAVILTAGTPLFLQRAQTVNLDIFVLLAWAGYIVFIESFAISTVFLFLGIMSKSLIGFYPLGIVCIYHTYLFLTKAQKKKDYIRHMKRLIAQGLIASSWFVGMLILFGQAFWQQHIIESHFKRVTASIESHFGQRTYYVDLLIEQIGLVFFILALIGLVWILYSYFVKKQLNQKQLLFSLYLLPWFVFLNVTKTKIFWYLLPALPQFAYLASIPIQLVNRYRALRYLAAFGIVSLFLYTNIYQKQLLATQYSDYDDHYRMSIAAKEECTALTVLVPSYTRETYQTLDDLGLTITTTNWWGEHPSIVYYFEKPVAWSYSLAEFNTAITTLDRDACVVVTEEDVKSINTESMQEVLQIGEYHVFKTPSSDQ